MFSGIIFGVALFSLVTGAFWGLVRGSKRSFLRFFLTVLAFAVSMVICTTFTADPEKLLKISFVGKLIDAVPLLRDLTEAVPDLAPLVLSLPSAMFAPLVFFAVFIVLSAILLGLYFIAAAFLYPRNAESDKKTLFHRIVGMVFGVLQSAVVVLALMVPVVGMTSLTVEIVDTVEAEQGIYSVEAIEKVGEYRKELTELRESQVYLYAERFGAGTICDALMKYEIEDGDGVKTTVDLRAETILLAKMYAHSFPLQNTPAEQYNVWQAEALSDLSADLADSDLLRQIVAGLLSAASESWKEGESFLGIEPLQLQGKLSELPSHLYAALSGVSAETISADLKTVSTLVSLLAEHGVLGALVSGDAAFDAAASPEALAEITACLRANPRTAPVADALVNLVLDAVREEYLQILPEGDASYVDYRDMLDQVANAVNSLSSDASLADRIDSLSPSLASAFAEYGVDSDRLPSLVLDAAADLLLDRLSEKIGQVSADDVALILAPARSDG